MTDGDSEGTSQAKRKVNSLAFMGLIYESICYRLLQMAFLRTHSPTTPQPQSLHKDQTACVLLRPIGHERLSRSKGN